MFEPAKHFTNSDTGTFKLHTAGPRVSLVPTVRKAVVRGRIFLSQQYVKLMVRPYFLLFSRRLCSGRVVFQRFRLCLEHQEWQVGTNARLGTPKYRRVWNCLGQRGGSRTPGCLYRQGRKTDLVVLITNYNTEWAIERKKTTISNNELIACTTKFTRCKVKHILVYYAATNRRI